MNKVTCNSTITINMGIGFLAQQDEKAQWVAHCPVLDLTAYGVTYVQLVASICEIVQVFFVNLYAREELAGFLRKHGVSYPTSQLVAKDASKDQSGVSFDIPWSLSCNGEILGFKLPVKK